MKFEVGKFYRHIGSSEQIHVMGVVTGSFYWMGPAILVAEKFGDGQPMFVGGDAASADDWEQVAPWQVDVEKASVHQALEGLNDACVRDGCSKCGGSGRYTDIAPVTFRCEG